MLARIAHELYWIGRSLARAEHTARMLDGALPRRPPGPPRRRRPTSALLGVAAGDHGRRQRRRPSDRDDVVAPLTLDPDNPASVAVLRRARPRGRAARCATSSPPRCGRRSTRSTSGCCGRHVRRRCAPARTRVYAYVRERCALFWGVTDRTMLRDEALRVPAGGRRDRGRRHDAADAARGAADRRGEPREADARGQALALLQAMGGLPGLPPRDPGAAEGAAGRLFLLYERAYPDSVAPRSPRCTSALTAADRAAAPPRRCCGSAG